MSTSVPKKRIPGRNCIFPRVPIQKSRFGVKHMLNICINEKTLELIAYIVYN